MRAFSYERAASPAEAAARAAEVEAAVAEAAGSLSALGLEQLEAALRKAEAENGALRAELEELEEILGRPIAVPDAAADAGGPEAGGYPEEAFPDNLPEAQPGQDYPALKVSELKPLLRARGLPVSGRKADLVARLEADDSALEAA